jgi:hypothetical protein
VLSRLVILLVSLITIVFLPDKKNEINEYLQNTRYDFVVLTYDDVVKACNLKGLI